MIAETVSATRAAQFAFRWRFRWGVRSMWRACLSNCCFANIARTPYFTESNAMSPCSPIVASTKLLSQGAIELRLDVGRDVAEKSTKIDRKSVQNRSQVDFFDQVDRLGSLGARLSPSGGALSRNRAFCLDRMLDRCSRPVRASRPGPFDFAPILTDLGQKSIFG